MTAALVAVGLVVALLSVLVVGLLRSHAEILKALHALGVDLSPASTPSSSAHVPKPTRGPLGAGATVPDSILGVDTSGGSIAVSLLGEGRLTLLAFLSSGCLTCRPMWEAMAAGEGAVPTGARLVAVTKGPHEESPASVHALTSARLTTVMSSEAWVSFNVPGSPYFVLVDGKGSITGEGTASSWPRVLELLGEALLDDRATGFQNAAVALGGSGRKRLQQVDDTLRAAGIEPGHPSLHPEDRH